MSGVASTRVARGQAAHASGRAAEQQVAEHYRRRGFELAGERWRGRCGEIDLILRKGGGVVFVEVKKAGTLYEAAHRLGARQLERLFASGAEYLGLEPLGQNTPARFDFALVGASGEIEIIENVMPT